ncbi:YdaS family helix-turn-helix protein [Avibacterium paragallinarum]|uniref:Helix-turn-helix domain-containing protein n=1 Tax=Avibacterium paragallinarum TaxID=728 RepID=A0A3G8W276_AVIPA|nr:YdaS family helix-turn-helix protein [Avibacterium paragallinarum]AZI13564.1 helix-turn-helix domain-containing protein [Avibacterium paragallinarum]QIR10893.1 helix-turn-helix domain-containing protein [Avibacterium paragallinarum]QJE10262.1 helix-turn-helix domain-containing protein [Avibacterium paragallinarum]QJE12456.1 helix-turn-helix domain-containing protein [Avibacterium paragallinarum]QJE14659.1 helix-turn-helix domain-containing protein [Avibacterium paragallinarum]
MNKVLTKIIAECGGTQKSLAKKCGVSQMTVSYWLRGGGINAKYIPLIAKASNGKVTEAEILRSLSE